MSDNWIYRLLLVAVLLQWSISLATSDTFHIVTSPATPCPVEFIGEPCVTLQQYVSSPSISHGNITLLFETGTHSMSHAFSASNAHSYTLSGYNVSIECISNTVSFALTSIQHLNITGLKLSNCGSFTFNSITYMYFTKVIYSRNGNVQFSNLEYLHLTNCSFNSNRICPLLRLSNVRNGSITYSSFRNNQYSYCYGGTLYLTNSELNLISSVLVGNVNIMLYRGGAVYGVGSSLVIRKSYFLYHYASSYGGAIYTSNCRVYSENNSFWGQTVYNKKKTPERNEVASSSSGEQN